MAGPESLAGQEIEGETKKDEQKGDEE